MNYIYYIVIAVCKGKLLHFDFSISCVDIELRLLVYNFSSIDDLPRLLLHAWMLMSCIIYSTLPVYLQFVFFVFFAVNRVIVSSFLYHLHWYKSPNLLASTDIKSLMLPKFQRFKSQNDMRVDGKAQLFYVNILIFN